MDERGRALAHFELAYARLPRFERRDEARQLFYADSFIKLGISPRAVMHFHGLDTRELDLLKYSPDQPRVPAGQGRASGQWTAGDGEGAAQSPSSARAGFSGEVMSGVSPDPVRPRQQYAQNKPPSPFVPYQLPINTGAGGSTGVEGDGGKGPAVGEAEGVARTIDISPDRFGQAAEHVRDAIQAGKPDVLTIDRLARGANRAAATGQLEKVPGMHLDEYPPAMFKEGGVGASVRAISPHDNMSLGAYIGSCCRRLPNGARIKIRVGD